MAEAETLPKPFELTEEQQKNATRICDQMVINIQRSTGDKVKQACEDMDKVGVPKQTICSLICQRAEEMGYSEGHLRRLVPTEYKDQEQREARLTHEGEHHVHQHETATTQTLEVKSGDDIQPPGDEDPNLTSTPSSKRIGSVTQRLKSELHKLRVENTRFKNTSGITFVYECLKDEIPDLEFGQKVKEYFSKNKSYLKWLKEDKKHEASLNVEGKTRAEAYLDNQNKMVDEQDQKEAAAVEKKSRKPRSKKSRKKK